MKRIIAIGGGQIEDKETFFIDQEIVSAANKKRPRLLFIPTASNDSEEYTNSIEEIYGKELGCEVETLYLVKGNTPADRARERILNSDIIYVGGGNTEQMLKVWRQYSVDKAMVEAYERGIVLSGLSAGAICWFSTGLGLVNGLYGPHYNMKKMKESFNQLIYSSKTIGIAVEDNCAIDIRDDQYKIIKSKESAKAYRLKRVVNEFIRDELTNTKDYQSINKLLREN